jgi:hypothetical protein
MEVREKTFWASWIIENAVNIDIDFNVYGQGQSQHNAVCDNTPIETSKHKIVQI